MISETSAVTAADWDRAVRRLQWHLYLRDVEPSRAAVFRECLRLTGEVSTAEDLLAETLQRGFRVVAQLCRGIDQPVPFLKRTARNLWTDWQRRPTPVSVDMDSLPHRDHSQVDAYHLRASLRSLARRMPAAELRAFVMRDLLRFTSAETAELLGTTNAAVKMAVMRARRRIREHEEGSDTRSFEHETR